VITIKCPLDEGDYAVFGGTGGTVRSVGIMATTVTTGDDQVIVIPDKSAWDNRLMAAEWEFRF
jgi:small conductance mechanosensitive channel